MTQEFLDSYRNMLLHGKCPSIIMDGFSFRDNVERLSKNTLSFYEVNGEHFAFLSLKREGELIEGYQIADGEIKKINSQIVPEFSAHVTDLFSFNRSISMALYFTINTMEFPNINLDNLNFLGTLFTIALEEDYLEDISHRDWIVPEFNLSHILNLVLILVGEKWHDAYLTMGRMERAELKNKAYAYLNIILENNFTLPF